MISVRHDVGHGHSSPRNDRVQLLLSVVSGEQCGCQRVMHDVVRYQNRPRLVASRNVVYGANGISARIRVFGTTQLLKGIEKPWLLSQD